MEPRTLLSAVTWTGDAGDDNWDTPANWSSNSVPGAAADVTIDTTATVVHSAGVADAIDSLTSSGPLSITGGTLSIASASTTGSLTIDGGTLADAGGLTVGGLLTLTAGTLSGSGDVDADGGILSTAGGVVTLDGQTLTNAARQTATWNGILEMEDGATFNNLGSFLAIAQGSFDDYAGFDQDGSDPSAFDDAGSFTASLATGASSTVQFDFMNVPFVADGATVDVQSGYLDLLGGGTSTAGTFTVESGATLGFGGGTQTLDAASSIVGAGTVNFNGFNTFGTTTIDGTYDVTGATILSDSKANFDGTVESLGASLSVSDGTMSFNVPLSATAAAVPERDGVRRWDAGPRGRCLQPHHADAFRRDSERDRDDQGQRPVRPSAAASSPDRARSTSTAASSSAAPAGIPSTSRDGPSTSPPDRPPRLRRRANTSGTASVPSSTTSAHSSVHRVTRSP